MDHNELTRGRITPNVEIHACHLSSRIFTTDAFPQMSRHAKVLHNFATYVAKAGAANGNRQEAVSFLTVSPFKILTFKVCKSRNTFLCFPNSQATFVWNLIRRKKCRTTALATAQITTACFGPALPALQAARALWSTTWTSWRKSLRQGHAIHRYSQYFPYVELSWAWGWHLCVPSNREAKIWRANRLYGGEMWWDVGEMLVTAWHLVFVQLLFSFPLFSTLCFKFSCGCWYLP